MLNSGKKFRALRDKKNKYSNSRVIRKINSERNKNHSPPCKLNGRSLMCYLIPAYCCVIDSYGTDPSKCINDQTLTSSTEFCRTSLLKLSDMSDQILPGRSESLHSQIVKL